MSEQKINFLLVGEVEKRPVLYNFNLSGYSKKQETEKAWAEVGNVVKLTVAECKERWKNIRAVFVRHMKPPKSGTGIKPKKAYYLSDALQFTVPYIKALVKPSGNLSLPPPEDGEQALGDGGNDDDDFQSETLLSSPSSPPPTASKSSSHPLSVTTTLPQHQDNQSEPIKQHVPNKKMRPAEYDDMDKAFMEYFDRKNVSSSPKREHLTTKPREEALKMFLLSFLPDLMKMDDGELRQFKRKTLDAVDDIMSARSTSTRPPSSSCPSLSDDSSLSNQMPPPTTSTLEN